MKSYQRIASGRSRRVRGAPLLALGLAASLVGCGSLLQVDNPNNIKGDDIKLPSAATFLANGALAQVSRGFDGVLVPYSMITDELDWSGSRDAWGSLDKGFVDPVNEFIDGSYPGMASGRWLADEAIRDLSAELSGGTLKDPTDLARAYLYGAMSYTAIADMFKNFVFSNKDSAGSPIGVDKMGTLYDQAVTYCNNGLAIAGVSGDLQISLTAMKARAQMAKGIWNKVGIRPISPGNGLVSASDASTAAATANTALGLLTTPDWTFQYDYGPTIAYSDYGYENNVRQEMRLGHNYVAPDPKSPTWLDKVVLNDPIDGVPDPVITAYEKSFKGNRYYPLTVLSARELHLIVAENGLIAGDTILPGGAFRNHLNQVRALGSATLTPWSPGAGGGARAMLIHERRVNLFGQARRLADMYRFGVTTDNWQAGSDALARPGTFLPITVIECRSNPNIGADKCSSLSG